MPAVDASMMETEMKNCVDQSKPAFEVELSVLQRYAHQIENKICIPAHVPLVSPHLKCTRFFKCQIIKGAEMIKLESNMSQVPRIKIVLNERFELWLFGNKEPKTDEC